MTLSSKLGFTLGDPWGSSRSSCKRASSDCCIRFLRSLSLTFGLGWRCIYALVPLLLVSSGLIRSVGIGRAMWLFSSSSRARRRLNFGREIVLRKRACCRHGGSWDGRRIAPQTSWLTVFSASRSESDLRLVEPRLMTNVARQPTGIP